MPTARWTKRRDRRQATGAVADNGSNWFFSGSSDRRWDDEDLNQLKGISGSAFEVIEPAGQTSPC